MRNTLLFLSLLFLGFSAQAQVIFSEDFDGISGPTAGGAGTYTFPSGWRLRNVDNRTPATSVNYVNEAWERREDFQTNVLDSVMFSTSWYSPAGAADDWAWTPAIALTGSNCQLSWNAKTYDPMYPDGYEVRIMTMSSTPGGPTGGPAAIGNQITNSTQVFSTAAESTSWINRTVNLTAYAGETIWVGFHNNSTDKFLLVIDDVIVQQLINHNAAVSEPSVIEYPLTPITVGPEYPLSAKITNTGTQQITGVTLTADVYDASNTLVHTETSAPATLNAGANQVFTLGNFVPTAASDYTLYYYSSMNETDQTNGDDSLVRTFTVSDSVYARDNGVAVGQLGIGAGNGGYIGQQFHINTADTLTTVSIHVTAGYTGEPIAAVIWDMSGGFPNQIIASTDTLFYPDDSADTYILPMYSLTVLNPGDYVVTAVEFDSTLAVGLTTEVFVQNTTWVDWPTNTFQPWGNNEDFGTQYHRAYMIRANFADVCHNAYDTNYVTLCYGQEYTVGVNIYTETGTYLDVLPNGYCDSLITTHLIILDELASTVDTTICFGDVYTVGTNDYTVSGSYTDVFPTGTCDSTVTTNLTVLPALDAQASVSTDLTTFSCTPVSGATYQWINCDNNTPISGATSSSYTAGNVMTVAVIITSGNCSDTSDCVTNDGLSLAETQALNFDVHPNPATDKLTVTSSQQADFVVLNETGQVLRTFTVEAGMETELNVAKLARGIYFVKNTATQETVKVVLK